MSTEKLTGVILVGGGRMGALLAEAFAADGGFELLGTYDIDNVDELDEKAPAAELVVDFSAPGALPHIVAYVRRTGAAFLSGTTGLTQADIDAIIALGEVAPVVRSSNYSMGVAVLRRLASEAALALDGWDIEIVEAHHNQKADAPSGTAVALLDAVDPKGAADVVYGRQGMVGARPAREIGMHSLRGGTAAGTHEVHLFGPDEELVLTHRASSRRIFVSGALAAAKRLLLRSAGVYTFDQLMFS